MCAGLGVCLLQWQQRGQKLVAGETHITLNIPIWQQLLWKRGRKREGEKELYALSLHAVLTNMKTNRVDRLYYIGVAAVLMVLIFRQLQWNTVGGPFSSARVWIYIVGHTVCNMFYCSCGLSSSKDVAKHAQPANNLKNCRRFMIIVGWDMGDDCLLL
jgi:hypothetical protein